MNNDEIPSPEAIEAADYLSKCINRLGNQADLKHIVKSMINTHRTLNQSFTSGIIIPFIQQMAMNLNTGNYDLRNKEAVEACSIMWKALCKAFNIAEESEVRLPLI